ncbi:UvrD-helicase domain-containing protein [Spirosoma sp. 209]|uniref:UvrD-helicase domain-containing protein n=1 Tax=Spirosoma sp. 209 TaxID=1955701 RepID=UPI00137477C0|nr:ATP-dependent helicase [Spirosoma sp. 209]
MQLIEISSDDSISIEQHFRVSAGPGAGKTHWLINHLKNILSKSDRLGKTRKIACITFTNVAVEAILSRFDSSHENLEVSTIHSFLYKNIVKPYVKFIADEYNLNHEKIDGHDDVILSNYTFIEEWKNKTGQHYLKNKGEIVLALSKAKWELDSVKGLTINPDKQSRVNGYSIKNEAYLEYKRMAWKQGVIHHDDVLFFSYNIIMHYPFVIKIIRAKFPYLLIDEFQDTNPIQMKIIERIGETETKIGIIGDYAQSIYGFQGVNSSAFVNFTLPGISNYQISFNRRSTIQIIEVLNHIRKDIEQKSLENTIGEKPIIFYGDMITSYELAASICGNEEICSLARVNITANSIQYKASSMFNQNLIDELEIKDTNYDRKKILIACIRAAELGHSKKYKDALKHIKFLYKADSDKGNKRALKALYLLVSHYESFRDQSFLEFSNFVSQNIYLVPKVSRGPLKKFCEENTYKSLAMCLNYTDDLSLFKTIHKSKGDEFDNVFLALKAKSSLMFLTNPNLIDEEEHRVNYVAVSRAKRRLFIYVPSIKDIDKQLLNHIFDFKEVKSKI